MAMRLFIYKNEAGAEGKVLSIKASDTVSTLKHAASKKLRMRAKRLFLASGAEVQSVDELQNNDTVYVSAGEAFFKTKLTSALAPSGHPHPQALHETFHLSVLGSGGVGKSALTLRFVKDYFVRDWDPTIEDAYRKTLSVQNQVCHLEILDTAGQDDFESLRAQWMMDKDGYVFVYSMDSRMSLHELQPFFELHLQINETNTMRSHRPHPPHRSMPPIVMVANKKDLVAQDPSRCQVSSDEGRRIARSYGAIYMETSALTGQNVNAAFEQLVIEARRKRHLKQENVPRCPCMIQ
jgi:GTPase KRas protein